MYNYCSMHREPLFTRTLQSELRRVFWCCLRWNLSIDETGCMSKFAALKHSSLSDTQNRTQDHCIPHFLVNSQWYWMIAIISLRNLNFIYFKKAKSFDARIGVIREKAIT